MDKLLEKRIVRIPEKLEDIQKSVQNILTGISKWAKEEDYMQLQLLKPRLLKLISDMEVLESEVSECLQKLSDDTEKEVTENQLLQQKAMILEEKAVVIKLLDDITASTKIIEKSERAGLAGEILDRCRILETSIKELL